jgi:hypothetical protein
LDRVGEIEYFVIFLNDIWKTSDYKTNVEVVGTAVGSS